MKPIRYLLPLLFLCSSAMAQKAIIIELPTGGYLGIAYLADGTQVVLTDVQVLKIPANPTLPPTTKKVDRVTYVYEKNEGGVPPAVAAGLNKLNSQGILATEFEDDIIDGSGDVPDQYKIALEESKKAGIPCLVVQAGKSVVRVIKVTKDTTIDDVLGAAK